MSLRNEEWMMKKTCSILIMAALLGGSLLQTSFAARSLTKSYKVSVTLPPAVNMHAIQPRDEMKTADALFARELSERTVIVRNNQKIIMQTTVVK